MDFNVFLEMYYNSYEPPFASLSIDSFSFFVFCIQHLNEWGLLWFSLLGLKIGLNFLMESANY